MVEPPMNEAWCRPTRGVKWRAGRLQRGGGCVKRPALPPPLRSPEDAPAIGPARFTLVGLAFLASGAAALVYQVVWQRILALHTGMGITSIALIVSAFMAGLGLGSHAGGVLSARVDPPRALRLFAVIELLVGLFASLSCRLYYDLPERFLPGLYGSTLGMGRPSGTWSSRSSGLPRTELQAAHRDVAATRTTGGAT